MKEWLPRLVARVPGSDWLPRLVARVPVSIHAKLLAAFLAIVVLLITVGAVGLQVLSEVNRRAEELVKLERKIAAYRQLQRDTTAQLSNISSALLAPNQRMLEATLRQLNQYGYDFDLLQFAAKDEAELFRRVREDYDRFIQVVTRVVELFRSGKVAEGRELQLTQAGPLADRLERLTNQLVKKVEADMVASIEASHKASLTSRWVVIGFAVGSIGLALVLGYAISWSLIGPVKQMGARLKQIASGDFSQRVEIPNRDELGLLAMDFNRTAAQLQESYANLEQKVESRTRDLTQALEQQTATSEFLRVISSSPTDLQPVLDAVGENAARLCDANVALIFRVDGDGLRLVASHGPLPIIPPSEGIPIERGSVTGRAVLDRITIHIHDLAAESDSEFPASKGYQKDFGNRTTLATPLLREGIPIGAISIRRMEVRPFSDKQIELLKTFADEAVIAIENVRLFQELQARNREVTEALEQQTATSEILGVISSSPTDIQPVFDTIVRSAARLCDAVFSTLIRFDGELLHLAAHHNFIPEGLQVLQRIFPSLPRDHLSGRAILNRTVVHVPNIPSDPDVPQASRDLARAMGYRSLLAVPMLRGGNPIGAILVTRVEGAFPPKQIDILKSFADQAVIAIENVRLFQELQVRNRDLTEALEQQTATSEVLKVISRSTFDLQPVLETLIENATRLCGADHAHIFTIDGELLRPAVAYGVSPYFREYLERNPLRVGPGSAAGRAAFERRTVHIHDVLAEPGYQYSELQEREGYRNLLAVPMLREEVLVGVITLRKKKAGSFTDKQIELVTTFADQAVIAIENVRLFHELQARTEELARSVRELKALGEVSQAVSSTLDLQTVLTTIVSRAVELSGTNGGLIYEYDEATQEFHLRATHGMEAELIDARRAAPIRLGEGTVGKAAIARAPVQVPDILDEHVAVSSRVRPVLARLGYRSILAVPLLFEERIVGGLFVSRKEVGSFSPEVVDLLQTFATQSVLAIQNARLFRELAEKGQQLALASQHKSQFLANMSHELRTPLNAILGYTELIQDNIYGAVPEKVREVLERLAKSGRHLLGLINDVLDLSKIEAGQLTLALTDYSLKQVIQTVVLAVEALAAEKRLALKVTLPPDLPPGRGDERRLTQVLLNLVGNAIKFTEAGEVRVEAKAADGTFRVAVADTGPGIAEADQEKIFEEFQQADTSSTRQKGGTGLGLAIAKRIIALHGGRIGVTSRLGEGATFWFTVPVRVERQTGGTG